MLYKKAYAEVIYLSNADVIKTLSGDQSLDGVSAADLAKEIGVKENHAQQILNAASGYKTAAAFISALLGGTITFDDMTVNDAQAIADGIHNACFTNWAKTWSPETESDSFGDEENDFDSEW